MTDDINVDMEHILYRYDIDDIVLWLYNNYPNDTSSAIYSLGISEDE